CCAARNLAHVLTYPPPYRAATIPHLAPPAGCRVLPAAAGLVDTWRTGVAVCDGRYPGRDGDRNWPGNLGPAVDHVRKNRCRNVLHAQCTYRHCTVCVANCARG